MLKSENSACGSIFVAARIQTRDDSFLPQYRKSQMHEVYESPPPRTQTPYLEVKDAQLHSIRRLAVGQEGVVIEDAANSLVRRGGFGLGGQGRSLRVYSTVQVPEQQSI